MTCRYSDLDWLDVLYNSVRKTKGGIVDAAKYLTERRGKSIHPESLRAKLKAENGDALSVEMAELLTEWMQEKASGEAHALDWLHALNARFGLVTACADDVESEGAGVAAVMAAHVAIAIQGGVFAQELHSAAVDGAISRKEAEAIEAAGRKKQRKIEKAILAAKRAAGVA